MTLLLITYLYCFSLLICYNYKELQSYNYNHPLDLLGCKSIITQRVKIWKSSGFWFCQTFYDQNIIIKIIEHLNLTFMKALCVLYSPKFFPIKLLHYMVIHAHVKVSLHNILQNDTYSAHGHLLLSLTI